MKANLKTGKLEAFGREIKISSTVRNEINKLRTLTERPVASMPDGKPIMPRSFPAGTWEVYRPLARDSKELAPFFIPTSAFRRLPVWTVENGHYGKPTTETVIDKGYGIHFSEFINTIGCIKVHNRDDLLWLVGQINAILDRGEKVYIEVVES